MRRPLIRFRGDESPIAWREWLFAPPVWAVTLTLMPIAAAWSIPSFMVDPDHHAHVGGPVPRGGSSARAAGAARDRRATRQRIFLRSV